VVAAPKKKNNLIKLIGDCPRNFCYSDSRFILDNTIISRGSQTGDQT